MHEKQEPITHTTESHNENPTVLPNEIWEHAIASFINKRTTLFSLRASCRFFNGSQALRLRWNDLPRVQLVAGGFHTWILTSENKLLGCGKNTDGQLGVGHNENQDKFLEPDLSDILGTGEIIQQIAAGDAHTVFLTSKNRVLVSGNNESGQLGLGHTNSQNLFTELILSDVLDEKEKISKIFTGNNQTLLLTSKNRLLVSGNNACSQLGFGFGHAKKQLRFVESLLSKCLFADETIQQIAAGIACTLVLTSNNRLMVCGHNGTGQLGLGHEDDQSMFIESDLTAVLAAGETIQQFITGWRHTLLLTSKNRLLVAGSNIWGQLGLGNVKNQLTFTECSLSDLLAEGEKIIQFSTNRSNTLLLTSEGRILWCGINQGNRFGIENTPIQSTFIELSLSTILAKEEKVKQLRAGGYHILLHTSNDRFLVGGSNEFGQLGLGNNEEQGIFQSLSFAFLNSQRLEEEHVQDDDSAGLRP